MSVYKLSVCPKNGGKKYDKMTFSISKNKKQKTKNKKQKTKNKKQKAKGKLQNFKNVTLSAVEGQISNPCAQCSPLERGWGCVLYAYPKSLILAVTTPLLRGVEGVSLYTYPKSQILALTTPLLKSKIQRLQSK